MKFTKLYKLFLVISPLSFFPSIFFSMFISKSDVMSWRAFSVLMPICGISLVLGLVLLIIDKGKL